MSKIGKKIIKIKNKIKILKNIYYMKFNGNLGSTLINIHKEIIINIKNNNIKINIKNINKKNRKIWGLFRALINNLMIGITIGFKKKLEIIGLGFKAKILKKNLILKLGYSHDIIYIIPPKVNIDLMNNILQIESHNKYLLGQTIADIKKIKKIDPYKGKGIKNFKEKIKLKIGKKK